MKSLTTCYVKAHRLIEFWVIYLFQRDPFGRMNTLNNKL